MKILVKLPTRERPRQFLKALSRCISRESGDNEVTYLVTYDHNDSTFTDDLINSVLRKYENVEFMGGLSTSKIHACNRDLSRYEKDWDVVMLLSDDMICQQQNWDNVIESKMRLHYPDMDGVLFFNDGFCEDRLNTMCILGHKYFDRFGYIYHPSYISLWCDNEFMKVANHLGKQTYFPQVLFRHEHPSNVLESLMDHSYTKNQSFYNRDKNNYESRKKSMFVIDTNSNSTT
jgi:hypothetical protein